MNPQTTRQILELRQQLSSLHGRVASAATSIAVAQALQQYLAMADRLFLALSPRATAGVVSGYVPGGAVVSAAISSLGPGGTGSSGA